MKTLATLLLLLTLRSTSYSQCVTYDVHACIDYISDLHVQGNQMWWVHIAGSPPGTHGSCSGDVLSVNGTPWGAWNVPFTLGSITACMNVTSVVTVSSGTVVLTQAPSGTNGWETIYRITDAPSAAHPFAIVFSFCPTSDAPTSTFTAAPIPCSNKANLTYTGNASSSALPSAVFSLDGGTVLSGAGAGPYLVEWPTSGIKNISFTITECGLTSTSSQTITLTDKPKALFTLNATDTAQICVGGTVNFDASTSLSTLTPTTYNWQFSDATTATGITTTKTYTTKGVYKAELTITDGGNCTDKVQKIIQVADVSKFWTTGANRTTICEGDTTMLTGVVKQTTTSVPFPIPSSTPLALPDGDYVCYTTSINYTQYNSGAVITSAADVQNAFVNIWHEYSGDLSIQVICPSGQAVALFNASHTDKGGGTGGRDFGVPFSTAFNYNWNSMGSTTMAGSAGNPVPAGNYIPDQPFTNLVGCPANGVWTLKICDFNDNDEGSITSWGIQLAPSLYSSNTFTPKTLTQNWVANPDIIATPTPNKVVIKPTTSGSHTYTYTTTNNYGCTNDTTITITVNPKPIANFTVANTCFNTVSTFVNTTTANGSTIAGSGWQFNNTGVTPAPNALSLNASYTFAECNNPLYSATLVSVSDKGCADTVTKPVTVYCLPVPNFTAINGCELDDVIQFTNTSTNGAGTTSALAYAWKLDTKTSTLTNPTQTYNIAGTKTINLMVTDVNTCTDNITKTIQIYPKPVADFTVTNVCMNVANVFTDASTLTVPATFTDVISNYNWTYDTLASYTTNATTPNTAHAYTLPATQVKPIAALIIKTNNNCYDTLTKPVIVWTLPKANYTINDTCYPWDITFKNNSSIDAGTDNNTMASMNLTWGDGATQAIANLTQIVTHNYASSGNYVSELNVVSNHGCVHKFNMQVTVHAKPIASYAALPNKGCEPLCVSFTNASTQNNSPIGETITSYNWTYNDYNVSSKNDKSSNINTSHCYDNPSDTTQIHVSQLIVTTTEGCMDTLTAPIEVYPLPLANFSVSPEVTDMLNPQINIKDGSHLAYSIMWDYGNTVTQKVSNANPLMPMQEYVYSYTDSGSYIITQLVKTNKGCADSTTQKIRVNPIYTVYVPNAFSPDGDGINDFFMVRGENIKNLSLVVFNRWGDVIARINDISSKGWDGTDLRFETMSELEVYNWKLEYTDVFDVKHRNIVGTVTLVK